MNAPVRSRTLASLDSVAGALSDGTRRAILLLVRDDERSAGAIAGRFPQMTRPAISQHLKVLHDAGLVSARTEGKFRLFQARSEGMAEMWQFVDEMWTDRLGRLKLAAEGTERSRRESAPPADDNAFIHQPTGRRARTRPQEIDHD
jgi:DNA-binding transcriptional ArsR family regulator